MIYAASRKRRTGRPRHQWRLRFVIFRTVSLVGRPGRWRIICRRVWVRWSATHNRHLYLLPGDPFPVHDHPSCRP